MNTYTGMYIVRPNLTEEATKAVIADINNMFVAKGAKITEVNEWGMKDLAYEINDFTKGYYVKFHVEASAEAVAEYDRICNIKEDVIRHIIVRD